MEAEVNHNTLPISAISARASAIFCIGVALILILDAFVPLKGASTLTVAEKKTQPFTYKGREYLSYSVRTNDQQEEEVPASLYRILAEGDTLIVERGLNLTGEANWRRIALVRNGEVLSESRSTGVSLLLMLAAFLLIPLLTYQHPQRWHKDTRLWIGIVTANVVALIYLVRILSNVG